MRAFGFLLLLLFLSGPALAQDWQRYENAGLGYVVDIPPEFTGNGDGMSFQRPSKGQGLVVWGGVALGGFERAVTDRMASAEQDGWTIAYQAVTPSWASFSAVKGQHIRHQRMIALCDDSQYAAFTLDYMSSDATTMDPVVERLERSLRAAC
jgi:hypothetical protein